MGYTIYNTNIYLCVFTSNNISGIFFHDSSKLYFMLLNDHIIWTINMYQFSYNRQIYKEDT